MSQSSIRLQLKVLGPVLAATALTAVLAGCSGNVQTSDTTSIGMDTSSSADAQMPSSQIDLQTSSVMMDTASSSVAKTAYANGTFSAVGNYRSPAGGEAVDVTLTLNNGVITDATFQGVPASPRSAMMQNMFAAGFKEQVVGKSIDALNLTVVNGSSLTPQGFMDAVAKIKAQAKV